MRRESAGRCEQVALDRLHGTVWQCRRPRLCGTEYGDLTWQLGASLWSSLRIVVERISRPS